MKKWMLFCFVLWCLAACHTPFGTDEKELRVSHTVTPPQIDGNASDRCWSGTSIYPIDQLWAGKLPHAADFMGRYRIRWDSSYLYLLAEIYDDSLVTYSPEAAERYWDRDGIDLFIKDEPSQPNGDPAVLSYHITLDSLHADTPILIGDSGNVKIAFAHTEHLSTWEIALKGPPPSRQLETIARPLELVPGKLLGLAIAYNDNDKSKERESRMGNRPIQPGISKTQGGTDPGVYQPVRLDGGN